MFNTCVSMHSFAITGTNMFHCLIFYIRLDHGLTPYSDIPEGIRILVPTTLVDCVHSVGTFAFSCTDLAAAQSQFPPCGRLVFT